VPHASYADNGEKKHAQVKKAGADFGREWQKPEVPDDGTMYNPFAEAFKKMRENLREKPYTKQTK
jgi:hypothetical protein